MDLTPRRTTAALAVALGIGGVAVAVPHALAANGFKTYDAVVALDNCSGAVVRFPGAADTDKALVLTNGHCLPSMPKPNTFLNDVAANRMVTVLGGDDAHKVTGLQLDRLLYATMTGTDVSLYRSTATYADLRAKGVVARAMATSHPAAGTAIQIPSGYWKQSYSCSMDGFVPELREGGYVWKDAIRYTSECSTPHGSSGSPVIDTRTGDVVAINNTGNDDGERCTMNNPCEVDATGRITVLKGRSYAEQTYQIAACYSAGRIDLTAAGCTLYGAKPGPNPAPTPTPTPTPTTPAPAPTTPAPQPTTPAPAPTTPAPQPPTPTDGPAPAGTILNGDFEMGSGGWGGEATLIDDDPTHPAHSGAFKLWMGGEDALGSTQTVTRSLAVPADRTKATLSFWAYVTTQEKAGRVPYDRLTVRVADGSRARARALGASTSLSNADAAGEYRQHTVDLSAYAGRTVTLEITATNDRTAPTSFGLDDFAFAG